MRDLMLMMADFMTTEELVKDIYEAAKKVHVEGDSSEESVGRLKMHCTLFVMKQITNKKPVGEVIAEAKALEQIESAMKFNKS